MAGRGGCDRTNAAACGEVFADLPNCKRPSQRILYHRTRSRDPNQIRERQRPVKAPISPRGLPPMEESVLEILPAVSAEMCMTGIAMMAARTVKPPPATPQDQHDRQHHTDRKAKEPAELRAVPQAHVTNSLVRHRRMTTIRPLGKHERDATEQRGRDKKHAAARSFRFVVQF